jgi:ATP-dependent DNA helicase RecQ
LTANYRIDIAKAKGLTMDALIEVDKLYTQELSLIYWIDDMLDDDQQEIHDYFMESVTDKIEDALKEFEGDYDIDELRFMYQIY